MKPVWAELRAKIERLGVWKIGTMTHLLVLTEWETLYLMVINPVFSSYNPVFYGYNYQYLMVITQYLMAITQEPCIISAYQYLMVITHWEKNTGSNPLELQLPYFFRCTHFWQLGVNYGWWFIVDRVFHWYVDENVIGDNMDHQQKVAAKLLRTCGFPKVIPVVFSSTFFGKYKNWTSPGSIARIDFCTAGKSWWGWVVAGARPLWCFFKFGTPRLNSSRAGSEIKRPHWAIDAWDKTIGRGMKILFKSCNSLGQVWIRL